MSFEDQPFDVDGYVSGKGARWSMQDSITWFWPNMQHEVILGSTGVDGDPTIPVDVLPSGRALARTVHSPAMHGPANFLSSDAFFSRWQGDKAWAMDRPAAGRGPVFPFPRQFSRGDGGVRANQDGRRPWVYPWTDQVPFYAAGPLNDKNITFMGPDERKVQQAYGTVVRGHAWGMDATLKDNHFLPSDHWHIADHRGPTMPHPKPGDRQSTRIYDVDRDGGPSVDYRARGRTIRGYNQNLDRVFVVHRDFGGCAGGDPNDMILGFNLSGRTGFAYGVCEMKAGGKPFFPPEQPITGRRGGRETAATPHEKTSEPTGSSVVLQAVLAAMAYERGGVLTPGHPKADKHRISTNSDGLNLNPMHIHINGKFTNESVIFDGRRNMIATFEPKVGIGLIPLRSWEMFNPKLGDPFFCGAKKGGWDFHTKVNSIPVWPPPWTPIFPEPEPEPDPDPDPKITVPQRVPREEDDDEPGQPTTGGGGGGRRPVTGGGGRGGKDADPDDPTRPVTSGPDDNGAGEVVDDGSDISDLPEDVTTGPDPSENTDATEQADAKAAEDAAAADAAADADARERWKRRTYDEEGRAQYSGPTDWGPAEIARPSIELMPRPGNIESPVTGLQPSPYNKQLLVEALTEDLVEREGLEGALAIVEAMRKGQYEDEDAITVGITGLTWREHMEAPKTLHITGFYKHKSKDPVDGKRGLKRYAPDYTKEPRYIAGDNLSEPREHVWGTADGLTLLHPPEIKSWETRWDFDPAKLRASSPQTFGLYPGVKLGFGFRNNLGDGISNGFEVFQGVDPITGDSNQALIFDGLTGEGASDPAKIINFRPDVLMDGDLRVDGLIDERGGRVLRVGTGRQFATIAAGIAGAIALTPTITAPVIIRVDPGFYNEASATTHTLPANIHLVGFTDSAVDVIVMNSTNTNIPLFTMTGGNNSIQNMLLFGQTGASGEGIAMSGGSVILPSLVLNVRMFSCTTGVHITGGFGWIKGGDFQSVSVIASADTTTTLNVWNLYTGTVDVWTETGTGIIPRQFWMENLSGIPHIHYERSYIEIGDNAWIDFVEQTAVPGTPGTSELRTYGQEINGRTHLRGKDDTGRVTDFTPERLVQAADAPISSNLFVSTELALNLEAGTKYIVRGRFFVDAAALSGTAIGLAGTATVNSMKLQCKIYTGTALDAQGRFTTMASTLTSSADATATYWVELDGEIDVSAAGTFIIQHARRNAAAGTSTFERDSSIDMGIV